MAAVLLLVFLPVLAASLFMFGSLGHLSLISVLAVLLFVVLGASIVVGMMRMSVGWDHEQHHP